MSLRAKFVLPVAIFGAFIVVFLYDYWLPHTRAQMEAEYRQSIERHLNTVATGIIPLLLARQLDSLYEYFDALKRDNPDWRSIEYVDSAGRVIYPLEPPSAGVPVPDLHTIRRAVTYLDRDLGTIVLNVDFAPRLQEQRARHNVLIMTLLAALLVYLATAWLAVELIVRKPVNRLALASRKLAGGVFDVRLPKIHKDEVGTLVASFAAMRDAIRGYQTELIERSRVLMKSEQRLAEAQRIASLGSWELDLTTNRLTWSDEIYRIFGIEQQAFGATYEAFLETVHPEDRAAVDAAYTGSMRTNAPYDIIHRIVRRDTAAVRYVHEKAEHVRDESGAVMRSLGTVQDITELRMTEVALRRSERNLALHLRQTVLGVVEWDREFRAIEWNPAAESIFGYRREEALGRRAAELIIPPEIVGDIDALWDRLLHQTGGTHNVNENVTRDGRTILCEWFNTPLADDRGTVETVMSLVQDITEHRRAEETSRLLGAIVENSDDAIIGKTLDGVITSWNRGAEAIYGYRANEAVGRPITMLIPDERKGEETQILAALRQGRHTEHFETVRKRKDGKSINVSLTTSPIKDAEDRIIGASTIARDITQRMEAVKELKRLTSRNEMILNSAGEGIFGTDVDGNVVFMNQTAQEMLLLRTQDVIGKNGHKLFHHTKADGMPYLLEDCPMHKSLAEGKAYRGPDEAFWTGDGRMFPVEQVSTPIFDHGAVVGAVVVFRDITQRKQSEEEIKKLNEGLEKRVKERTDDLRKKTSELAENQRALMNIVEDLNLKTDALGQANAKLKELDRLKSMFIASMSHELRTPLNSVIGFSSILLSEWLGPVNAEQKENLATILRSGKHLLNLINDVIDVSKIEAGKVEPHAGEFDLYDLVSEAAGLVQVSAREKGLSLSLELHHQPMRTDRRRLLQCLLNFLSNAVKFTDKGGITVRTRPLRVGAAHLVELSVEDTGIGVREEDLAKLFQPFVRLVSPAQATIVGTGLGLYLTNKLTREILKGEVLCTSTYGKGSTFTIKIPAEIT